MSQGISLYMKFANLITPNYKIGLRQMIWSSFALFLAITVLGSFFTLYLQRDFYRQYQEVVTVLQPLSDSSHRLNQNIREVEAGLGFYLLTKDKNYIEEYQGYQTRIDMEVARLFELAQKLGKDHNEVLDIVVNIRKALDDLHAIEKILFDLANNKNKNFVALNYAEENIAPLNTQSLGLIGHLVSSVEDMTELSHADYIELLHLLFDIRYTWASIMNYNQQYLSYRNENSLQQANKLVEVQLTLLNKLDGFNEVDSLGLTADKEQLIRNFDNYTGHIKTLVNLIQTNRWREDAYILKTRFLEVNQDIESDLNQLVTIQDGQIAAVSNKIVEKLERNFILVVVIAMSAVFVTLIIAFIVGRVISHRLGYVMKSMNKIAEGEGTLSQQLETRGNDEVAKFSQSFNKFIDKVRNIVELVLESTDMLVSESQLVYDKTQESRYSIYKQQQEIEQVVSSMDTVAQGVEDVATNATSAADTSEQAKLQADNGSQVARKSIDNIRILSGEIMSASEVIQQVSDDAEKIDHVLSVINDIAEQTNLLALNAAIEAARAGEQGRGFAVVADEVRSLSQRSNQQTIEIKQIIDTLQSNVKQAVEVMAQSQDSANHSVKQIDEVGEALDIIDKSVTTITALSRDIASQSKSQSDLTQEVKSSVEKINSIAEGSVKNSNDTANIIQNSLMMSIQLQGMVNKFLFNKDIYDPEVTKNNKADHDEIELF